MKKDNTTDFLSFKKKILFSCILLVLILLFCEMGFRFLYYQRNAPHILAWIYAFHSVKDQIAALKRKCPFPENIKDIKVESSKSLFRDDPILGFSTMPGKYSYSLTGEENGVRRSLKSTIILNDEDGYRITSENPERYIGKPEIWIFGCSYTWGHLLDNQYTFPWLVQERLSNYRIRNFGIAGYGNIHALLQLEEYLKRDIPYACVFVYNSFHLPRNVASPSRLREYVIKKDEGNPFKVFHHPQGFIDDNGKLGIRLVPIQDEDKPDPHITYMQHVTMMIFNEIKQLCEQNNIIPFLAFQTDKKDDLIITFCDVIGFNIIDIYVDVESTCEYQLFPFDLHPNEKAHKIYADNLISGLQKHINMEDIEE